MIIQKEFFSSFESLNHTTKGIIIYYTMDELQDILLCTMDSSLFEKNISSKEQRKNDIAMMSMDHKLVDEISNFLDEAMEKYKKNGGDYLSFLKTQEEQNNALLDKVKNKVVNKDLFKRNLDG
jgi:histone acetyltransferase (RNA polymerase elongator complex component)